MSKPFRIAFLGCGFVTRIHSRHMQALRGQIALAFASRDGAKAAAFSRRWGGVAEYSSYEAAIADDRNDAVLVAVPPRWHLDLTLQALAAGRHVLVEKPAFPRLEDYETVVKARDRAGRVVLVGENDHYKPLAVQLRRLLKQRVIGSLVFAHFSTIGYRQKPQDDWRNDLSIAGGDAFFEEGIHWLHFAGSLGPVITDIHGFRPDVPRDGPDRRVKSMLVSFKYDNGAVGSLYYSREIPSLLKGMRQSKLFGQEGVITFESNGLCILARGRGLPKFILPGFYDFRGYRVMYRDFLGAIRDGRAPEMSLERAADDQRLMDRVYATAGPPPA